METFKKSIKTIITVSVFILAANYGPRYFHRFFDQKSQAPKLLSDKNRLLHYMNIVANSKDNSLVQKYTDSSAIFVNQCNADELDSLKSFVRFDIKWNDDYWDDIISFLKGRSDSNNILRQSTVVELQEICIIGGDSPVNFNKATYGFITQAIKHQVATTDSGKDAMLLSQTITYKQKRDSALQVFNNRIFAVKQ